MYGNISLGLAIVMVVGGLVALSWSSNVFVDGAAWLAKRFGISPFIVGMVIIGFGTTAPELCVSAFAGLSDHASLSLGNAYGSCIFNIAVIVGIAALIHPIDVKPLTVFVGAPVLALVAALSLLFLRDGTFSRFEAAVLLVVFAVLLPLYCWFELKTKGAGSERSATDGPHANGSALRAAFGIGAGLAVLIGSSHFLVWGAVDIARSLGVSELLIGLTIVAVGTSLPELASAIASARKGQDEFVLGNILGSNLFNTLAVVGVASVINPPKDFSHYVQTRDLPLMMALSFSIAVFGVNWKRPREAGRIGRVKAAFWILVFLGYTALMLVQETP
jgi:cation:H+ antiporter